MQFSFRSRRGRSNPFVLAIVGIIFFLASFAVLWTNEGRINFADVAEDSVLLWADRMDPAVDGKLVAAAGQLTSSEQLGDPPYFPAGTYARLDRRVEMYAWEEVKESDDDDNYTYSYRKQWTSSPDDSSSFHYSRNHYNPPMRLHSQIYTVSTAQVGAYAIDPRSITFPTPPVIELATLGIPSDDRYDVEGNYLFMGEGTLNNPQIGDLRISYAGLNLNTNVTVFGEVSGERIVPFMYKGKHMLYRAFLQDREGAIAKMGQEYLIALWGFRAGGFLLMWIGLMMLFGPITALLNFVPVLGGLGKGLVVLVAFVLALVLSLITVVIAALAHNLLLLAAVMLLLVGGLFIWVGMRRNQNDPVRV